VKKKLIEEVLPKYWEVEVCLIYWLNFCSSFIAIYYTYMKYYESKEGEQRKEEFGRHKKKNMRRKLEVGLS
jgi:hypothetical protein